MQKLKKEFGKHYLIELINCNPEKIKFVKDVKDIFLRAARKSETTMLESFFYQFEPYGMSGVIFIAESHFSIHTWPEDKYAGVDILTCGEMYPERSIEVLKDEFEAGEVRVEIIPRGF